MLMLTVFYGFWLGGIFAYWITAQLGSEMSKWKNDFPASPVPLKFFLGGLIWPYSYYQAYQAIKRISEKEKNFEPILAERDIGLNKMSRFQSAPNKAEGVLVGHDEEHWYLYLGHHQVIVLGKEEWRLLSQKDFDVKKEG